MKAALDPAFLRRLRFVVRLPVPRPRRAPGDLGEGVPARRCRRRELDLDRLARFDLTGGSIRNIALDAAFLAAEAGKPVTMALVLEAARAEFRKLERPIDEADFRGVTPRSERCREVQTGVQSSYKADSAGEGRASNIISTFARLSGL